MGLAFYFSIHDTQRPSKENSGWSNQTLPELPLIARDRGNWQRPGSHNFGNLWQWAAILAISYGS
jgi:hypothetical protein